MTLDSRTRRLRARMVQRLILMAALSWSTSAWANTTHHHLGSGSGASDDDADCLRWEAVDAGPAMDGGGTSDASAVLPGDAGAASSRAGMVCVEHATLFGCDCAVVPRSSRQGGLAMLVVLVWGAVAFRRKNRR
jgi:hypothetical protein